MRFDMGTSIICCRRLGPRVEVDCIIFGEIASARKRRAREREKVCGRMQLMGDATQVRLTCFAGSTKPGSGTRRLGYAVLSPRCTVSRTRCWCYRSRVWQSAGLEIRGAVHIGDCLRYSAGASGVVVHGRSYRRRSNGGWNQPGSTVAQPDRRARSDWSAAAVALRVSRLKPILEIQADSRSPGLSGLPHWQLRTLISSRYRYTARRRSSSARPHGNACYMRCSAIRVLRPPVRRWG